MTAQHIILLLQQYSLIDVWEHAFGSPIPGGATIQSIIAILIG